MGNGHACDENRNIFITFAGQIKSMILSTDINF